MARYSITLIFLVALASMTFLDLTDALRHDFMDYIIESVMRIVKEEHLTCDNFKEYCARVMNHTMAVEMCEAIIGTVVCENSPVLESGIIQ